MKKIIVVILSLILGACQASAQLGAKAPEVSGLVAWDQQSQKCRTDADTDPEFAQKKYVACLVLRDKAGGAPAPVASAPPAPATSASATPMASPVAPAGPAMPPGVTVQYMPAVNQTDCRDRGTMLELTNPSRFDIYVEAGAVQLSACSAGKMRMVYIRDPQGMERMAYMIPANSGSIKYYFQFQLPPVLSDGQVNVTFRAYYPKVDARQGNPESPTGRWYRTVWNVPATDINWTILLNERFTG